MSSPVADLIIHKLDEIIAEIRNLRRRVDDIQADVDDIDRFNRPYGDGTKPPRRPRR